MGERSGEGRLPSLTAKSFSPRLAAASQRTFHNGPSGPVAVELTAREVRRPDRRYCTVDRRSH